jgi:hypothetical protein
LYERTEIKHQKREKNPFGAGRPGQDADAIKNIFQGYIDGKSIRDLAREWKLGSTTIKHILGQDDYVRQGIVGKDVFDQVQTFLKARRSNKK